MVYSRGISPTASEVVFLSALNQRGDWQRNTPGPETRSDVAGHLTADPNVSRCVQRTDDKKLAGTPVQIRLGNSPGTRQLLKISQSAPRVGGGSRRGNLQNEVERTMATAKSGKVSMAFKCAPRARKHRL
jgi:hypothetical protein